MSERARQLQATAEEQIDELVGLMLRMDEAMLRRPCPGREKLGDGTVAASVQHTAGNYQRIADFVQTSGRMSGRHAPQRGGHRIPRLLRARGHGPAEHAEHSPGAGHHDDQSSAETVDPSAVVTQLLASRDALGEIAGLTDGQLDAIPPKDSFRFCDGKRTLEQVLAGLLKHQRHQVDALTTAIQ
jgi:hypothetical protein